MCVRACVGTTVGVRGGGEESWVFGRTCLNHVSAAAQKDSPSSYERDLEEKEQRQTPSVNITSPA